MPGGHVHEVITVMVVTTSIILKYILVHHDSSLVIPPRTKTQDLRTVTGI